MPTENTIDRLYRFAEAAVDRLSVADNHWTFKKIPGQFSWWCLNHGHREAMLNIEFDFQSNLRFRVLDTGLVRFIDGTSAFEFAMSSQLSNVEEDAFLDINLIAKLNYLHNIAEE